jgi:hypothetical protein
MYHQNNHYGDDTTKTTAMVMTPPKQPLWGCTTKTTAMYHQNNRYGDDTNVIEKTTKLRKSIPKNKYKQVHKHTHAHLTESH